MWRKYSGEPLELALPVAVENEVNQIRSNGYQVKICIGTDSLLKGNKVNFATALVFIVLGNGGYMFVKKLLEPRKMALRDRMMTEIGYSIETAYEIDSIARQLGIDIEIHADINSDPRFASHVSYHDAMGYIKAMGYRFVAKPNAFASSVCADRFTG